MNDALKIVAPEYPRTERARRHEGAGRFRLAVDPKTGAVVNVATVKSTGFRALDQSAVWAFRRWQWKPGTWIEFQFPVAFELSYKPLRKGDVLLPKRDY
jgi:TonB family protein